MFKSPAPIAEPIFRGSARVANHACSLAFKVFSCLNLRSLCGMSSTYCRDLGQTGSASGISLSTKSSSSPWALLSGINQMPIRGVPSITVPDGEGERGDGMPTRPNSLLIACHLPCRSSLASTIMPTVHWPARLISGVMALRRLEKPSLSAILNSCDSARVRHRCWTTCLSSGPSTSSTRSDAGSAAMRYLTSISCSEAVASSSFE